MVVIDINLVHVNLRFLFRNFGPCEFKSFFACCQVKLQAHNTTAHGKVYKNALHCTSRILLEEGVSPFFHIAWCHYPSILKEGIKLLWLFCLQLMLGPVLEPAVVKFKIDIHYHINILKAHCIAIFSCRLEGCTKVRRLHLLVQLLKAPFSLAHIPKPNSYYRYSNDLSN